MYGYPQAFTVSPFCQNPENYFLPESPPEDIVEKNKIETRYIKDRIKNEMKRQLEERKNRIIEDSETSRSDSSLTTMSSLASVEEQKKKREQKKIREEKKKKKKLAKMLIEAEGFVSQFYKHLVGKEREREINKRIDFQQAQERKSELKKIFKQKR